MFFTDKPFPESKICRSYNQDSIILAAERAEKALNFLKAQDYIRSTIIPLEPKYSYKNESDINPAFENVEQISYPLQLLGIRIWVLRSNFTLVTGVKNAYQKEYNYHGLAESFNEANQELLNWKDRYGHPSLAIPEGDYDGRVFYAGYLCQRKGFLQVYLASGRFDRKDLNEQQTAILEAYVAAQFQVAYGTQDIVFDYADPDDTVYHSTFFGGGIFPKGNPQRRYTQTSIREILTNIVQVQAKEDRSLSCLS